MHRTVSGALSAAILLAGGSLLGCTTEPVVPSQALPRPPVQLVLVPYDSTVATTLVADTTVIVPDSGTVVDTVAFFGQGAFADTAFLEGYSTIQADNGFQYPYNQIAGAGRVYYYRSNGDVWYRDVQVQFFETLTGGGTQLEDLGGSTPTYANPLQFRDTDAATHGSQVILTVGNPVFTGQNANDSSFAGICAWINFGSGGCVPGPDFTSDYIYSGNPNGGIRLRAYSRGAPTVAMTLSRNDILPVFNGQFRAIAQAAGTDTGSRFTPKPRFDTVRVNLGPGGGGPAAPGLQVAIEAAPVDSSGGHMHSVGSRPTGTFFTLAQAASVSDSSAGSRGSIGVVLDSTGHGEVIYRTSGISGLERLIVHRDSVSGPVLDTTTVVIRVQGLVELANGGNIDTIGVTTTHRDSHWGTPTMVSKLQALADSAKAAYDSYGPGQKPSTGTAFPATLPVNDMSLMWGGLFDYDVPARVWRNPHAEHRDGKSADVSDSLLTRWNDFDDFLRLTWPKISGLPKHRAINDERASANHLHLRVP